MRYSTSFMLIIAVFACTISIVHNTSRSSLNLCYHTQGPEQSIG
jgi:hypothetical protein